MGFLPELQIIGVISAAMRIILLAGKAYLKSTQGQEIKKPLTCGHTHQTSSRSWLENQLSFFFLLNWVLDPAGKSTHNQACQSQALPVAELAVCGTRSWNQCSSLLGS